MKGYCREDQDSIRLVEEEEEEDEEEEEKKKYLSDICQMILTPNSYYFPKYY